MTDGHTEIGERVATSILWRPLSSGRIDKSPIPPARRPVLLCRFGSGHYNSFVTIAIIFKPMTSDFGIGILQIISDTAQKSFVFARSCKSLISSWAPTKIRVLICCLRDLLEHFSLQLLNFSKEFSILTFDIFQLRRLKKLSCETLCSVIYELANIQVCEKLLKVLEIANTSLCLKQLQWLNKINRNCIN